jgi:RNA polymerase sigma factor (sigma-70 family)
MTTVQANVVIRHLRRTLLAHDRDTQTDGQLLEHYLARRDETAFEALVRRHGPMVFGVCRRVLRNPADAEDAFQATFLVLVRKATTILPRNRVGNWLHGVAYRTAMKARTTTARRQARERMMFTQEAIETEALDDWLPLLDRELNRLPEKYRLPVVLCDLEGKTRKEAARHLDWPEGTVATRLTRARALLAQRLSRQGVALTAGAIALALSQRATARVPLSLMSSTVQAATDYAAGSAAGVGSIPARVAVLTEGVLKTMLLTRLKSITLVVLLLGLLSVGVGTSLFLTSAAAQDDNRPPERAPTAEVAPPGARPVDPKLRIDLPGGPPPVQALVSVNEDGELIAKMLSTVVIPTTSMTPDGLTVTSYQMSRVLQMHQWRRGTFQVYNAKLKKLAPKEISRRLQAEVPALVFMDANPIDRLHLRFVKEDTLVIHPLEHVQPLPPVAAPPTAPTPALAPILPPAPATGTTPLPHVPAVPPRDPVLTPPVDSPQPVSAPVQPPPPVRNPTAPPADSQPLPVPAPNTTPAVTAPPKDRAATEPPHYLHLLRSKRNMSELAVKMEGTWEVVKQRRGDKDESIEYLKGFKVVIRDDRMWLCRGNDLSNAKAVRFHLDATKEPAHIDTFVQTEHGEQVCRGLLTMNGRDHLVICEAPIGQPRPTKASSGNYVTLYRRIPDMIQRGP